MGGTVFEHRNSILTKMKNFSDIGIDAKLDEEAKSDIVFLIGPLENGQKRDLL